MTAEQEQDPSQDQINQLYVLVGALKILGFDGASQSFISRLSSLKNSSKR